MVDDEQIPEGVEAGVELRNFADAILMQPAEEIVRTRKQLVEKLGEPAMIDAAAVVGNFQRMVRIADSTGIPLDEPVLMISQFIREDLGINNFNASANSPKLPLLKRILGRLMAPFAATMLKKMAASRQSK